MKPRDMIASCHWASHDRVRVRCDKENDSLCVIAFCDSSADAEIFTIYLTPDKARRVAQRLIDIADYYDSNPDNNTNEEEII